MSYLVWFVVSLVVHNCLGFIRAAEIWEAPLWTIAITGTIALILFARAFCYMNKWIKQLGTSWSLFLDGIPGVPFVMLCIFSSIMRPVIWGWFLSEIPDQVMIIYIPMVLGMFIYSCFYDLRFIKQKMNKKAEEWMKKNGHSSW